MKHTFAIQAIKYRISFLERAIVLSVIVPLTGEINEEIESLKYSLMLLEDDQANDKKRGE